jgi:hypothetical protein
MRPQSDIETLRSALLPHLDHRLGPAMGAVKGTPATDSEGVLGAVEEADAALTCWLG